MKKIIKKYLILIILFLSIPAVRYLFVHGFYGVSDDLHVGWLYEMDRVIKMLQIPPRFVPDLSYGFGYPLFNFVYPLPFYIAESFHLIGFSLVNSIKIVFGLSIPFSMYFMYKLLRKFVDEELSLAGSVLYVYAPYRALEIFVRGTIGEIVAFVFFPLIILSFLNLGDDKNSKKWIKIGGVSLALLILSHNIMAYMFVPFLILLILAKRINLIASLKALFLGLLLSIFFWLPALLESKLMKYDTVFNFYDHYPTLKQFITPYWGYGASVPGPYDTMSFYMGIVGLLVFLFGIVIFLIKFKSFGKNEKIFVGWSVFVIIVSVFMMNHRSAFLWYNLPLLPYFQFPWRFLAMTTLFTPFLLIVFPKVLKEKQIVFLSFLIIFFAILTNFNYFKTSEYLGREDDYYINRYIPSISVSEEYKSTSEEYLRLPVGTEKRPDKVYPRAYVDDENSDEIKLEIIEINPLDAIIRTNSNSKFRLNYNKYYYPGWKAKIDNKSAKIEVGKPFGQISLIIPEGEHEVLIEYKEAPMRLVTNIVSIITLFALFLI